MPCRSAEVQRRSPKCPRDQKEELNKVLRIEAEKYIELTFKTAPNRLLSQLIINHNVEQTNQISPCLFDVPEQN